MKKRVISSVAFLLVMLWLVPVAHAFSVSAPDTVAGFETVISGSGMAKLTRATVSITKPDGSVIHETVVSNASGSFEFIVAQSDTRLSGIYSFAVNNVSGSFEVFPGEMSTAVSGVYTNKGFVGVNGVDQALVTVRIVDEFGNPLPYHEVHLTSSQAADRIQDVSSETDMNGSASFLVSSGQIGISTFTAVDQTADETIEKRIQIVFYRSGTVLKSIGGDPQSLLLAATPPSTVSKFIIDNLPATVNVNQSVSFRVSAVDNNGIVIPSYSGTVSFSSSDANAQLPAAYTFKASDQGRKTFDLGLSFKTVGTQKLVVQEQNSPLIKGEKTAEVVKQENAGNGQVKITKPATGTYSVNTLEVAGEATPSAKVKIFDNGQQLAEVTAASTGRFTFTTSLLADGKHTFQAESNGTQSSAVEVTIDSTPAQVEQVNFTKTQLGPGETTDLTIRSDPDLSSIQATVGDLVVDLKADSKDPGLYRATLTVPQKDGDYPVGVILTDKVGNVSPAVEVGKLHVDAGLAQTSETRTFSVPSKVVGVTAQPSNGGMQLTWQPAQSDAGVAFYRIYYGTDPDNLNIVTNTKDSGTSYTVVNLQNGTEYYFQVVGIDTKGNEGDNRSDIANAAPSGSARTVSTGQAGVLCEPGPCPVAGPAPQTPQDGPGVIGMIVAALGGAFFVRRFKKKR